jgi:hypothetical protein
MVCKCLTASLFAVALAGSISSGAMALPPVAPDSDARQWLLYVDGGDYAKGWTRAGTPFKAQVTAAVLQGKIAPVREPLGAILQRKLANVTYSNTAPGLPDGKYAIVAYSSRFANKPVAGETVWLDFEDSHWLVIGYLIGPDVPTTAGWPQTGQDQRQPAVPAAAPGAKTCSHQELVDARIARTNGYTSGPSCANGP